MLCLRPCFHRQTFVTPCKLPSDTRALTHSRTHAHTFFYSTRQSRFCRSASLMSSSLRTLHLNTDKIFFQGSNVAVIPDVREFELRQEKRGGYDKVAKERLSQSDISPLSACERQIRFPWSDTWLVLSPVAPRRARHLFPKRANQRAFA